MQKSLAAQLDDAMKSSRECEQEEMVLTSILQRTRNERLRHNQDINRLREEIVQEALNGRPEESRG